MFFLKTDRGGDYICAVKITKAEMMKKAKK